MSTRDGSGGYRRCHGEVNSRSGGEELRRCRNTLALFIKDSDLSRKKTHEASVKLTAELQEFYVALKKGQQVCNDALAGFQDLKSTSTSNFALFCRIFTVCKKGIFTMNEGNRL